MPAQDMDEEKAQRKKMRQYMRQQIVNLKEGVLLVRLQTKQNSIEALKKSNMPQAAARIQTEQVEFNKEIIAAFKRHFSFCPVYFFNASQSDLILSKQFNQLVFYNDSLVADTTIRPRIDKFLVAEFNVLQQDTSSFDAGSSWYHGENGLEIQTRQRGGNNPQISSLLIMSPELVQLRNPFPYYVRVYDSLPAEKRLSQAILKMQSKLQFYFEEQ